MDQRRVIPIYTRSVQVDINSMIGQGACSCIRTIKCVDESEGVIHRQYLQ